MKNLNVDEKGTQDKNVQLNVDKDMMNNLCALSGLDPQETFNRSLTLLETALSEIKNGNEVAILNRERMEFSSLKII